MCRTVSYEAEEPFLLIQSIRELQEYFVVQEEDVFDPKELVENDVCLCGTDVEAVLTRAGVKWELDEIFGDFVLHERP